VLWSQKKQSLQLVMMALLWSPPDNGAAVEAQEIEPGDEVAAGMIPFCYALKMLYCSFLFFLLLGLI